MTATESILLVLDNDRTAYDRCMELADWPTSPLGESPLTKEETARFQLADTIKEYVELLIDDLSEVKPETKWCIVVQLVRHAFDEIDWHEVADHYIAKLKETGQYKYD